MIAQMFMRNGDDFGMRIQDEEGNIIHEEEEEEVVPTVLVCTVCMYVCTYVCAYVCVVCHHV